MKKHIRSVLMILCCILFTLWIPKLLFHIQDGVDRKNNKLETTNELSELYRKYPIIPAVYADAYNDTDDADGTYFKIEHMNDYDNAKELRKKLSSAEKQIQDLLQRGILSPQLLIRDDESFQFTYGTISDPFNTEQLSFRINQVLSINRGYVRSADFTFLKQPDKIISMDIANEHTAKITESERKKIARKLITYYQLDDFDDWTYNNQGYESYRAKLQIICRLISNDSGYSRLQIALMPLGLSDDPGVIISSSP